MSVSSDRNLLLAYVEQSDEIAFRKLVERYLPMVQSVAWRGACDADLVEEIAQNAFALLARKATSLAKEVTISGWLFKTARYETLRLTRKKLARDKKMKQYAQEAALTETNSDPAVHFREPLDQALSQLNASDRNAIILRFYEHLNYRELGKRLSKTEAAAQKQVERCLKKLRRRLCSQGFAVTTATLTSAFVSQFGSTVKASCLSKLTPAALAAAPTLSVPSLWMNTLYTMASNSQIAATATVVVILTGLITWQSADLQASKQEMAALTTVRLQQDGEVPVEVAGDDSSMLAAETVVPEVEAVVEQEPEELPPIVFPKTPSEAMRLFVGYKLKEFAGRKRYGRKVLPPGTPEREAYERDKALWLADLSTMALSQGMLSKVWGSEDLDATVANFKVAYEEVFDLNPDQLTALLDITRTAIEAKFESRKVHPKGSSEAGKAEWDLQQAMLDRIAEVLNDEQEALYIGVFGKQPITLVNVSPPVIFDSEEQRAKVSAAVMRR